MQTQWRKRDLQGKRIDGRYRGVGLGCFIEGAVAGPREGCRIVLERDGGVSVYVGSSAIGQGLETVLSQIASDAIGLPMERIRLIHGSTTIVREGFGSFHSRSTVMGGSAVLVTASRLLEEIKNAAARRFGRPADAVKIRDGAASSGPWRATFAELAGKKITAEESFSKTKHTYTYGTHAVHVAGDIETGVVEILDYITAEDVGRIINPATLHGQVLGAVGGAVGNAIAAALTDFGVEPRDLPLSPAKLWNLIDRARAENPSGGA